MPAPDRIFANLCMSPTGDILSGTLVLETPDSELVPRVEYIRRDPAALAGDELVQAMIGAVVEEAAVAADANCAYPDGYYGDLPSVAIRARHPDAAAALAARDKRIRDAALEEAAKVADTNAENDWTDGVPRGLGIAEDIRALKEAQP